MDIPFSPTAVEDITGGGTAL